MAQAPSIVLLSLLRAIVTERPFVCSRCCRVRLTIFKQSRSFHGAFVRSQDAYVPLRKQLKDEARARKLASDGTSPHISQGVEDDTFIDPSVLAQYELTVGLELHVELSTSNKLFSPATTPESLSSSPNTHVAPFDLALPGTQPQFQKATLLPALRAALALNCNIQKRSEWDRKHYFWWDQPEGYQITQYYKPLALNGYLELNPSDIIQTESPINVVPEEPQRPLKIPLKQIQLEQDTAKTVLQPPSTHLLDFNRVSHPLIEIITLPTIHSPGVAAAFVRKVQRILKSVGASEKGMEMGGLRVDVNVSVKRNIEDTSMEGNEVVSSYAYAGFKGLGQRTEIKNLSSIAAVAAAIAAERNRQIKLLESGGRVEGETRGWTLGATATHRIRGKEGEVDYRYMPDPDLPPLIIGSELVQWVRQGIPALPSEMENALEQHWGISGKDAKTLVASEEGERLEWWFNIVENVLANILGKDGRNAADVTGETRAMMQAENTTLSVELVKIKKKIGRLVSNWVLYEMGTLLANEERNFEPDLIESSTVSSILILLLEEQITLPTARNIMRSAFHREIEPGMSLDAYIDQHSLRLSTMTEGDYFQLALEALSSNSKMAEQARKEMIASEALAVDDALMQSQDDGGKKRKKKPGGGKLMWFVGQMVRNGEAGRIQPERAEKAVKQALAQQQRA